MTRTQRRALLLLGLLLPLSALLGAGTTAAQATGKIAGNVTDDTGAPLPGVTVALDGTTVGTTTGMDGEYDLFGVRPGLYTVRFRFVGFQEIRVEGVQVNPGQTTEIDARMSEEVFEGEEVVITAERPVVQKDRTTTTAFVNSEQIESLPVTNLGEIVELQAGVVDGHFRGGRIGEVAYLVNGVPINNSFDGGAGFELEQNMVENLEIISGVFNAEYGQALSGVINITTRDVPSGWETGGQIYASALASGRTLEFVERTSRPGAGLTRDDFEQVDYTYAEAAPFPNQLDMQLSIGGPILRDRLGFRLSGRYLRDDGTLLARDVFAPSDPGASLLQSTGSQDFIARGGGRRFTFNGAFVWRPVRALRLDYNGFVQVGSGVRYDHYRKYAPRGTNPDEFFNQTHILSATYTLSDRAFATAAYSLLIDRYQSRLYDDLTGPYVRPEFNTSGVNAFAIGGNDLYRVDNETRTQTIKSDVTWQVNDDNEAKTGIQLRLHRLDNRSEGIDVSQSTNFLAEISDRDFDNNALDAKPWEFAAYAQNKLELESLIINAGLRLDVFDPSYLVPLDPSQAEFEQIPNTPGSPFFDENVAVGELISNRVDAEMSWQVSPRLGLAFPVSSTGVLRFSAGLFFQTPRFNLLYANPEYEVSAPGADASFGNAELAPERTLTFEAGLQQALTDELGVEVTVFSKDIRNLVGQEFLRTPQGSLAARSVNTDVGTIRGITFSAFQRERNGFGWTLDYTLQFAEGTASDPGETFARFQSGQEEITTLVRLDWDRRHVLTNTLSFTPVGGLRLSLVNRLETGTPYTTIRNDVTSFIKNNDPKPAYFLSDLRVYYKPPFVPNGIELFGQVDNLFDEEPQYNVYATTGLADESLEQARFERSNTQVGGVNSLDDFFFNPASVGAPRRVSLGLRWQF